MDLDEMQKKVNAEVVRNHVYPAMEEKKSDTGVSHILLAQTAENSRHCCAYQWSSIITLGED